MIDRYIEIQIHTRKVGHRCQHCNRPARVTGWRRTGPSLAGSTVHPIFYCEQHALEFGAIRKEHANA